MSPSPAISFEVSTTITRFLWENADQWHVHERHSGIN